MVRGGEAEALLMHQVDAVALHPEVAAVVLGGAILMSEGVGRGAQVRAGLGWLA